MSARTSKERAVSDKPFYQIHLDKRPLYLLALFFVIVYSPLIYIFIKIANKDGDLLAEITDEPITWLIIVCANILILIIYGGFIRQLFHNRPIIELYETKIRIYPVFTNKVSEIPLSKIIDISYREATFSQKGRFRVTRATKEKVYSMWKDTKSYHASMVKFKNPQHEITNRLKTYEDQITANRERVLQESK